MNHHSLFLTPLLLFLPSSFLPFSLHLSFPSPLPLFNFSVPPSFPPHSQKRLKDSMNVYDYFLNKSNVLQRVNKYVVAKGKSHDLSAQGAVSAKKWKMFVFTLSSCSPPSSILPSPFPLPYHTAPSEGFSHLQELSPRDLAALVTENLNYFSSEEGT